MGLLDQAPRNTGLPSSFSDVPYRQKSKWELHKKQMAPNNPWKQGFVNHLTGSSGPPNPEKAYNPSGDWKDAHVAAYSGYNADGSPVNRLMQALTILGVPIGKFGGVMAAKSPSGGLLASGVNAVKKKKKKGKKKAITNIPDLRQMDRDEAVKIAAKEPHLIKGSDGQYVGAPRGFTKKSEVNAQRKIFDKEVELGKKGGDWYGRARDWNVTAQGGDKHAQSLAASEQALMSAQAAPDANLNWAIDMRNAYEAGVPMDKVRTGAQARNYNQARDAYNPMLGHNNGPPLDDAPTGLPRLGKKTSIYGQHLDPNQPPATTGTNDIWHARQLGMTNKDGSMFDRALSPQEHVYMDYETMLGVQRAIAARLGGRADWNGAEIQAAPWVAGKGRALHERSGGKKTLEEGIAEASKTYPNYAPKYTVNVPNEQVPGASTGVFPGLLTSPSSVKREFTNDATWANPETGRDTLFSDMTKGYVLPTKQGDGAYMNSRGVVEHNPVDVAQPMSGFRVLDDKTKALPDYTKAGLDMSSATRGLLDFQEGSPWDKIIPSSAGPKTAFEMDIGRMPTKTEMDKVVTLAEKHGIDVTANSVKGLDFNIFAGGKKHGKTDKDVSKSVIKMLKGEFGNELKKIFPGADIVRGKWQGDMFDLSKELAEVGTGKATMKVLDKLESLRETAPKYYDNLMDSSGVQIKAKANLDRLHKWTVKLDQQQRGDYANLLKIVGDGKLVALRDYVKKYGPKGLPAIAAAALFPNRQDEPKPKS